MSKKNQAPVGGGPAGAMAGETVLAEASLAQNTTSCQPLSSTPPDPLTMGRYYAGRVAHWFATDNTDLAAEHNGELGMIYARLPEAERLELATYMQSLVYGLPADRQPLLWYAFFGEQMPGSAPPSLEEQVYQAVGLETLKGTDGKPLIVSTWADAALMLGEMTFAWLAWLVNGLLTMLVGEQGMGKSILALRIAACFLRGDPWPDGSPYTGELGRILWVETEASQGLNIERARAWGLPADQIITPLDDPLEDCSLDRPEHQAAIVARANLADVRFIIVDSLSGGNRRDENASMSLQCVKWLGELARDTGKPILLCHHLRKRSILDAGEGITLDQVRGHGSLTQVARVVWAIDRPDAELDARRLAVIKYSFGQSPDPLGMTIGDTGISFDAQPPETPHEETQTEKAVDLLQALLGGEPMRQTDIKAEAEGAGISWRTVERAKRKLNLVSRRGERGWFWSLPARQKPANDDAGISEAD